MPPIKKKENYSVTFTFRIKRDVENFLKTQINKSFFINELIKNSPEYKAFMEKQNKKN